MESSFCYWRTWRSLTGCFRQRFLCSNSERWLELKRFLNKHWVSRNPFIPSRKSILQTGEQSTCLTDRSLSYQSLAAQSRDKLTKGTVNFDFDCIQTVTCGRVIRVTFLCKLSRIKCCAGSYGQILHAITPSRTAFTLQNWEDKSTFDMKICCHNC